METMNYSDFRERLPEIAATTRTVPPQKLEPFKVTCYGRVAFCVVPEELLQGYRDIAAATGLDPDTLKPSAKQWTA